MQGGKLLMVEIYNIDKSLSNDLDYKHLCTPIFGILILCRANGGESPNCGETRDVLQDIKQSQRSGIRSYATEYK